MDTIGAIGEYMRANGYSAVVGDDCSCTLEDLCPCRSDIAMCDLGIYVKCSACSMLPYCGIAYNYNFDKRLMDGICLLEGDCLRANRYSDDLYCD